MKDVTVKCSDLKIFKVNEEIVSHMGTLKLILTDFAFDEKEDTINLSRIDSKDFRKILIWCKYHECCEVNDEDNLESSTEEYRVGANLTKWERRFLDVGNNQLVKYIMAAIYLDLKCLLKHACSKIRSNGRVKLLKELEMCIGLEEGKEK